MSINPILKPPTSNFYTTTNNIKENNIGIHKTKEDEIELLPHPSSTSVLTSSSPSSSLLQKNVYYNHIRILSNGYVHPISGISSKYSNIYPEELLSNYIQEYEFNNLINQINISSQSYWPCLTCYLLSYTASCLTCGCCCSFFCLNGNFISCIKPKINDSSHLYTPTTSSPTSSSSPFYVPSVVSSLFLCLSNPSAFYHSMISSSPNSPLLITLITSSCSLINGFVNDYFLNNFVFSSLTGSNSAIEINKNLHHFQLKKDIAEKEIELKLVPASLYYRLNCDYLFKLIDVSKTPVISSVSSTNSSNYSTTSTSLSSSLISFINNFFNSLFLPSYIEIIIPIVSNDDNEDLESNSPSSSSSSSNSPPPISSPIATSKPRLRKKDTINTI